MEAQMPVTLGGRTYYQTAEACKIAGTSRNTFLRWVRQGSFADVRQRDRHGWRLFTEDELHRLVFEVNRVTKTQ
jgi:predicted site-specific integrase-resolvase